MPRESSSKRLNVLSKILPSLSFNSVLVNATKASDVIATISVSILVTFKFRLSFVVFVLLSPNIPYTSFVVVILPNTSL